MTTAIKPFDVTRYRYRRGRNRLVLALATAATGFGLLVLAAILFKLIWAGAAAWGPSLFTMITPRPTGKAASPTPLSVRSP
ncbi:MAG: hypothetical protein WDN69_24090 [Aliidongia sp.]